MKTYLLTTTLILSSMSSYAWELKNPRQSTPPFSVTPAESARFRNIGLLAAELHEMYNAKRDDKLKRTQHHKVHGCLQGTFVVNSKLDPALKTPLFKEGATYDMWARFSNIGKDDDSEKDLRGMGVKILDPSRPAGTLYGQDFLGNDTPKHFVRTPEELMDFLHFMNGNRVPTPDLLRLLINAGHQAFKRHSLFEPSYHSRTHFQFGKSRVRFGFFPCDKKSFDHVALSENHLAKNLREEIGRKAQCFEFKVQKYNPKIDGDIADYTTEWQSQYKTVAVMVFPKQDIRKNEKTCGELSFDPWRAMREHQPLGVLNKARWYIYKNSRLKSQK